MKKRLCKLSAVFLTVLLLFQMPGISGLNGLVTEVWAETYITDTKEYNESVEDDIVVYSAGVCTIGSAGVLKGSLSLSTVNEVTNNGTIESTVTINNGTLTNNSSITGAVTMKGGTLNNNDKGSITGVVTMNDGTLNNNGTIAGETTMDYGTLTNNSSITGNITLNKPNSLGTTVGQVRLENKTGATISSVSFVAKDYTWVKNSGTINNLTLIGATFDMDGGEVNTLSEEGTEHYNGTITLRGGKIGTLSTQNYDVQVMGTDVTVTTADITKFTGGGTVNVADAGSISVTGVCEETVTVNVGPNTTVNTIAGASIKVNCNGNEYVCKDGESGTVQSGFKKSGKTVTITPKDDTVIATTSLDSDIIYSKGEFAEAVYKAADGYYFPENYKDNITVSGGTDANLQVTRNSDSEITVKYTISGDETGSTIDISLPAATEMLQGTGTFAVPDFNYGAEVEPTVRSSLASDTNDVSTAKVQYKKKDEADTAYSDEVPTAVGSYTAKATVEPKDYYKGFTVTDDFTIQYLAAPADPYTITGTSGDNGFYTSDVTVTPASGYTISKTLGSDYASSLTITESQPAGSIYLKNDAGEMTDAIALEAINIDKEAPTVKINGVDVEEGETYYGDAVTVDVSDSNLQTIKSNAKEEAVTGSTTSLALSSDSGIVSYKLEVTDKAGNAKTVSFKVAAEWKRTGKIENETNADITVNTSEGCEITNTGVVNGKVMIAGAAGTGGFVTNSGVINGNIQMNSAVSGTLTNNEGAEIHSDSFEAYESSSVTNKGKIDNLTMIGAGFTMDSGTVGTLNVSSVYNESATNGRPAKVVINGGEVTIIKENPDFGVSGTGTQQNGTITLGGGKIGTLSTQKFDVNVTGTEVTVTNADITKFTGSGTVNVADAGSISVTGACADTVTVNVGFDTKVTTIAGASIKVNYDGREYVYKDGMSGTLLEAFGKTVTITPEDATVIADKDSSLDSSKKYWYGDSTAAAVYKAADGYYFPENYKNEITVPSGTKSADTLKVTRKNDFEITVQYKIADSETASDIEISLPAATAMGEGDGTVTVPDSIYGSTVHTVKPEITTTNYDAAKAVVEYKKQTEKDSEYTKDVPTEVGNYTARVTFQKKDIYIGKSETCDFKITYLTPPDTPYTTSGTKGKNDFYTSDVTIIPAGGYSISDSPDQGYAETLTIKKSQAAGSIYLKKDATGEKTDAIALESFKIDMDAPNIKIDGKDAVSGKTYYGDSVKVAVADSNLSQIKVNGHTTKFSGKAGKVTLTSDKGVTSYTIAVTDMAGNEQTVKLRVAAEWTKSDTIPVSSPVKLETGKAYKLSAGKWKISGDETSYSGNMAVYVKKGGSYTLIQNE